MLNNRAALLLVLALLAAGSASAAFKTSITRAEGFAKQSVRRAAVVTAQCHEVVDCTRIEEKAFLDAKRVSPSVTVIPERQVREFLFSIGHTAYDVSLREEIVEEFALDAVIELRLPHAERGDGYGGRRGSQVKVELAVVSGDGMILVHGVATGRPMNVVTSPERVASNTVEQLLREIFGG